MEKEIEQKFEKGFNRSSKIMEYKIGINEARLLNTLVYKYNYWSTEGGLTNLNGESAFWITIPNLQVETNLSPSVIKRCLGKLKKSGLIEVYKKGIPAKNYYVLNREAIDNFDTQYEQEYEAWTDKIYKSAKTDRARFGTQNNEIIKESKENIIENAPLALIVSQLGQNDPTSEVKIDSLDRSKTTVTKNKITKNKKLKTNTNHINVAIEIGVSEEDLISKIFELQQSKLEGLPELYKEFYSFLRDSVPMFKYFKASDKDYEFIDSLIDSPIDNHFLATKIRENVRAIIAKRKECRFGNLFVGIKEMSENFKDKYTV